MAYLRREGPFFVGRLFLLFHLTEFSVRRCQESRESPTPKRQSQRRRACRVARELLAADFCPFFFYDFVSFCFVLFCFFFPFYFLGSVCVFAAPKSQQQNGQKKKSTKMESFFLVVSFFLFVFFLTTSNKATAVLALNFARFSSSQWILRWTQKKKEKKIKRSHHFFPRSDSFSFFLSFSLAFFGETKKEKFINAAFHLVCGHCPARPTSSVATT